MSEDAAVPVPTPPPTSKSSTSSSSKLAPPVEISSSRKVYTVNGADFEVPTSYELVKSIGYGAYGLVCSGIDTTTSKKLAIKKCRNVFKDIGDCKRVLREVKLLKMLHHENILSLCAFYTGSGNFNDVYIVSDQLDTDLSTVIRSKQQISVEHIKYFIYQVLRGLKYVHSANIVHRDLKPANVLVNLNCDLRICDFGLARGIGQEGDRTIEMTDYVVTRWYRPPELLMLNKHYDTSVDIWSVGCIFAEMLNRRPLFQGSDYIAQLKMICSALGVPPEAELREQFENVEAIKFIQGLGITAPTKPLESLLQTDDPIAHDFLAKMLAFNPRHRFTAAELMAHPYLAGLHDASDEPSCDRTFCWEHDAQDRLNRDQLRALFVEEVEGVV